MEPRSKTKPEDSIEDTLLPAEIDVEELTPDSLPDEDDLTLAVEEDGAALDADEDDAYENSDEALPNDAEERAISRHPSREGGLFDEI